RDFAVNLRVTRDDGDVVVVDAQRRCECGTQKATAAGHYHLHMTDASRARASPSAMSTRVSTAPPAMKNRITDTTAARLDPNALTDTAKSAGPAMPANFSNTEKNPKYSDDLCFGIIRAKSDRLSAWLPPCTLPTRKASAKNCEALVMKNARTLIAV